MVSAPRVDEHVAAGAEPGQRALGDARGQHRGDRGVDGVAALAQHPRPRLGGQRVAGSDYAARAHRARLGRAPVAEAASGPGRTRARRGRSRASATRAPRAARGRRAAARRRAGLERAGARRRGAAGAPASSKRVAITVIQTSSSIDSSMLAPKMMLASGCAASWTIFAASETSSRVRSGPPVIESRIERAPSTEVSSSGEETALSAARDGAAVAGAHADPEQRVAGVAHRRAHVGEVEVDHPRQGDQLGDPLDALAQDVVGDLEGLDHRRRLREHA